MKPILHIKRLVFYLLVILKYMVITLFVLTPVLSCSSREEEVQPTTNTIDEMIEGLTNDELSDLLGLEILNLEELFDPISNIEPQSNWDEITEPKNKDIPQEYLWMYYTVYAASYVQSHYPTDFIFQETNLEVNLDWVGIPYTVQRIINSSMFAIPLVNNLADDKQFITRYTVDGLFSIELVGSDHFAAKSSFPPIYIPDTVTVYHNGLEYSTTSQDYLDARSNCVVDNIRLVLHSPYAIGPSDDILIVVEPYVNNNP